jgi:hypothetical protein
MRRSFGGGAQSGAALNRVNTVCLFNYRMYHEYAIVDIE